MIKSILGGKSKNLFDISKVVQSAKLKNNGNGTLTVSAYGISAGILRDLCPNIKVGDTIKAYYTPISWTAPNPPSIMSIGSHIMDRSANPSFVVTDADLNSKVYFYNNNYTERNLPGTSVIGNIFITNDTTVTAANYKDRYVPHELTSYKSIMKVSDVCQLLDKSKYPATRTTNGITFTNNGDGSFTTNGTISSGLAVLTVARISNLIVGHKYYSPTSQYNNGVYIETKIDRNNASTIWQSGIIHKWAENETTMYISLLVNSSSANTVENAILIPQLFDLTEMFGPGNEPKTVAEFKAKFPNDYYPYSPSCFVTSFDERMPCKTKNLLNITPSMCKSCRYKDGILKANVVNFYYAVLQVTDLFEIGNTYTVSWSIIHKKSLSQTAGVVVYGKSKTDPDKTVFREYRNSVTDNKYTFTINDEDFSSISFVELRFFRYSTITTDTESSILNVQVELGTTATDYVPYGYV